MNVARMTPAEEHEFYSRPENQASGRGLPDDGDSR